MMNKLRIEALSDGVFSIVMTLLIIEIKVPPLLKADDGLELWHKLWEIWPYFRSFYISFAILGMYWFSHHSLFHLFAKHANRNISYLNVLFLCLISLIPFSTHLIGQYPLNPVAVAVYGTNIVVIGIVQYWMLHVTIDDPQVLHEDVNPRLIMESTVRMLLPPIFAVVGIITGFFHLPLSFFLFAFPVLFNIIPSRMRFFERVYLFFSSQNKGK